MAAVPIKPEYGPTLGQLLAPRWHAASPLRAARWSRRRRRCSRARRGASVLTLLNATYSHGGPRALQLQLPRPVPHRARTGRLRAGRRSATPAGALQYSFAVDPLDAAALQRRARGRAAALRRPATSTGCAVATRLRAARRGQDAREHRARLRGPLHDASSTAARCTAATCCCCPNAAARAKASRS